MKKTVKQTFEDLEKKLNELEEFPDKVSKQRGNIKNLSKLYDSELTEITEAMLNGKEHVLILNEKEQHPESVHIEDFFQDLFYERKKNEVAEKLLLRYTKEGMEIQQNRNYYSKLSYIPGIAVLVWGLVEAINLFWFAYHGNPASIFALEYLSALIKMGVGYGLTKALPSSLKLHGRSYVKKRAKKIKEYMPKVSKEI